MTVNKRVSAQSKELRKEIRDELRMTAAMRCYSILRSGSAKSLNAQYETMSNLFHGDEPSIVSNIKMLADGSYVYRDLFNVEDCDVVTSKSSEADISCPPKLTLKVELSMDKSKTYYANNDILRSDLEKKSRNGNQIVSGRSILEMAKKGTAYYRKALSFTSKKFDIDKMAVIDSGNSMQDVIEYVRVEMYQIILKEEASKRKTIVLDKSDDDDDEDLEDNYLESLKENKTNSENQRKTMQSPSTQPSNVPHNDNIKSNVDLTSKKEIDTKKALSKDDSKSVSRKNKNIIPDKTMPPENWFFPCWMSFVAYGPFVDKSKRLPLLEITDASKDVTKSRAQKRKSDNLEKNLKRASDNSSDRGFSTDQKLQLEIIDLTREQTNYRSRESVLMGLCIQEAALTKQIDRAERMAERRAPNYMDDVNNKWWMKVDELVKEQDNVVGRIAEINSNAMDKQKEGNNKSQRSNKISKNDLLTTELGGTMLKASQVEVLSSFSKESDISQAENNRCSTNISQTKNIHSTISRTIDTSCVSSYESPVDI